MIRAPTVLTLVVVLALTCVFGEKRMEPKKQQESESVLADIDPEVDEDLDNEDQMVDDDDDQDEHPVQHDPLPWGRRRYRRRRYRRRYRRRPYLTRRPYPAHKPTTKKPPSTAQACSTARPTDIKWDNTWHGKLFFDCPKGHSLTYMKSVFRNCQQDRLWKFDCGFNEASKEFCHWSHGYANDAKDGIFFYCPNNGFISGIQSIYVGGDRRYKFKCCNDEGFDHTDCHQSHHLNKAGEDFEYKVDRDKRFYITGISSCFNSEKRDRAWVVNYCRSTPETSSPQIEKKDATEN